MEIESDEESTQPPEKDNSPSKIPIEILETQGFNQQSSDEDDDDDDKSGMKYDVHFDPSSSPSKPLKRHFTRQINQTSLPFYTPDGMDCCSYTAIIIKMFKTYTQKLIKAQRRSKTTTPWGKPILPGRHHSKTIDFKKRGCLSVNMDSSADENGNFSSQNLSPEASKLCNSSKLDLNVKSQICSPVNEIVSKCESVNKSTLNINDGCGKLDDYDLETQLYNEVQSSEEEDDAGDDSDFVPEKESSKQRRVKPKAKLSRKRKKSISPIEFTSKKTQQKIVSDFFMQFEKNKSNSKKIKSSQSYSKDSKSGLSSSKDSESSQWYSKDSKSNQSKCSSKDNSICGSQDSNEMLNLQGEIYSTQVTEQRRTPRQGRKKTKVETQAKRRISISSDDELLEKHFKDVRVKKVKLNPVSPASREDIFNDGESKIKSHTTRTYQRKHRNKKADGAEVTSSVDLDKLLSLPTLHYNPKSSRRSHSPKNSQTDPENISSQTFSQIPADLGDLSSESPVKTVKKHRSFSLWDSEDELDSDLLKQASSNQSKTVANVKPLQRQSLVINSPSTSKVISPSHQANISIVSPVRREPEPEQLSDREEAEIEEVIECPLCGCKFPVTMIERHASTCGEEDIQGQEEEVQPRVEVERQTRSRIPRN